MSFLTVLNAQPELKPDISLWPPNHKYHTFTAEDFLKNSGSTGSSSLRIVSATSDEADDATADGSTTGDIVITCPGTIDLRAEREGNGDGRVYSIVIVHTDSGGNESSATAHVVVPHDRSGKKPVVEGPPMYTVTTQCDTGEVEAPGETMDVKTNGNSPRGATLVQNYPNPFNPSTSIEFMLTEPQFVVLKIYDMVGREVTTLISGQLGAGTHAAVWNADQQASGVYYYRIQTGTNVQTRKLLLMK